MAAESWCTPAARLTTAALRDLASSQPIAFYLSENHPALEGFYVSPFLKYQHYNQTGDYYHNNTSPYSASYEASLDAFGAGVLVGRHWIFKQRFSLDINLGPAYLASTVSSNVSDINRNDFLGYNEFTSYTLNG